MIRRNLTAFSIIFLIFCLKASAIEWLDKSYDCPLCGEENKFQSPISWGSYIYNWPSKYQFIFWPATETQVMYCCSKCHFTCYMWDFDSIPDKYKENIKKALTAITLDTGKYYTDIPMSQRLEIAEKVYRFLDKDEHFWCEFYRVKGYHLEAENKIPEAKEARKKALQIADDMLHNKKYFDYQKELLVISGSMKIFTGDKSGALIDLKTSKRLDYKNKEMKPQQIKSYNDYLNELADQLIAKLNLPTDN